MREGDAFPAEWISSGARLAALSRFHAGLAHDLNNRLTTLLGYLSVLDEILPGEAEMLADLHHAADEAAALVRLMHLFHTADPLPAGPVEAGGVLIRLHDLLGRLCRPEGRLPLALPDEPLYVCGEEGALAQILVIILGESLSAPPSLLRLEGGPGRVDLLFEDLRMEQPPEAALKLIAAMDGSWCQDTRACHLSFPALRVEGLEPPAPPRVPASFRLLLAEGCPQLCAHLADALRRAGLEVETAADVPDLAAKLAAGAHDAALLDTRLPGGGLAALRGIASLPAKRLWMEPYPGAEHLPAESKIAKPFRPRDLLHRLFD